MEVLYRLSYRGIFLSWGREDSNLRRLCRQVYSLLPLAARAHPRVRPKARRYGSKRGRLFNEHPESLRGDSNPQPAAYKAAALPLSYPGIASCQVSASWLRLATSTRELAKHYFNS